MSDDLSKVDWGKPIEDENGVPMHCHVSKDTPVEGYPHYVTCPSDRDIVSYYDDFGRPWATHKPLIRNVAEVPRNSEAPSDAITLTADQAAMLRKVLAAISGCVGTTIGHQTIFVPAQVVQDARDALTLLPEPVDADLVEVRRIVANALPEEMRPDILSGAKDHTASIQAPLACLKAGRALERDSREG